MRLARVGDHVPRRQPGGRVGSRSIGVDGAGHPDCQRQGMPEKKTSERARADKRAGKSASTQAGEYVREEIHHVREGKHGARSAKQAIAIGLSKARRAGVKVKPKKGASAETKEKAASDLRRGRAAPKRKPSPKRSRAVKGALKREGHSAASHEALAKQGKSAARSRSAASRSRAAKKAVATKGPEVRKAAAKKAAATRKRRASTTGAKRQSRVKAPRSSRAAH